MGFLNALASDGLSVGLRFYNAKVNGRMRETKVLPDLSEKDNDACDAPCAATKSGSLQDANKGNCKKSKLIPISKEQMLAGREQAGKILAEQGTFGAIQAETSAKEELYQLNEKSKKNPPREDKVNINLSALGKPAGKAGGQDLSDEEKKKIKELEEREAKILAEVRSAAQKGVSGAQGVQYTYETGPDGKNYINGIVSSVSAGTTKGTEASVKRVLSIEEEKQLEELKKRDREVRAHEQAHVNAAGGKASAPVYEYQVGPDGKRYAIGGHVDVSSGGGTDVEAALKDAEMIQRAAMAPGSPSSVDMAAANRAAADANGLKAKKSKQDNEEISKTKNHNKFAKDMQESAALKSLLSRGDDKLNGASAFMQASYAYNTVKHANELFNQRSVWGSI